MVPQVLFFVFLLLTSFVAITRDVQNGVFTLATAWNVTNTVILGSFVAAAAREARLLKRSSRLARLSARKRDTPALVPAYRQGVSA